MALYNGRRNIILGYSDKCFGLLDKTRHPLNMRGILQWKSFYKFVWFKDHIKFASGTAIPTNYRDIVKICSIILTELQTKQFSPKNDDPVVIDGNIFFNLNCISLLHFNRITKKNSQNITEVEKERIFLKFRLYFMTSVSDLDINNKTMSLSCNDHLCNCQWIHKYTR